MLDDLLHLRHSCQSSVNRRPPFRILFKKTSDLAARLHLAPIICPQWVRIWLLFRRKFINCLLEHCAIWKQGQFKHYKLLRYLRIGRKLVREMLRNYAKSCLKRKKLFEILQVAIKLASNLWKALGRRGRWGRGGRLVNKALFGEASPRGPQLSTSTLFKFENIAKDTLGLACS